MDEQTAQYLNWLALIGAPIVAGGIASLRALDSASAGTARRWGFWGTLAIGVALGTAAGVVIDVLHPGFIPPAAIALFVLEVPLSAGVGVGVGRACARWVNRRHPPPVADDRRRSAAGGTPHE